MPEECTELEDALLRQGPLLPLLSGDLRSRVLEAALEARARRAQGRRVLAGAGGVFTLLLWFAWSGPILPSAARLAAAGSDPPASAEPIADDRPASIWFSRREKFIAAMGDDWRAVEAEFKSREEFTRRIQM